MKPCMRQRILVAVDPHSERFLRVVLSRQHTIFVHDFHEAEVLLEQATFDLVVTSIYFDNSSMFSILRATRKSTLNKNTKFLCIRTNPSAVQAACDQSTFIALGVLGGDYFWNLSSIHPDKISDAQRAWLSWELRAMSGARLTKWRRAAEDFGIHPFRLCREQAVG